MSDDTAASVALPDAFEEIGLLGFPPYDRTLSLTAGIVSAYVSHNATPAADLPGLIRSVRAALFEDATILSDPETSGPPVDQPAVPAVPVKKSITPDHLVSLIDGKPYKSLKRHLSSHGLTPDTYRQKFGLPSDYPMVAANYSAQRSELARAVGLGRPKTPPAAAPVDQAA